MTVDRHNLAAAIARCALVAPRSPAFPILSGALVSLDGSHLAIRSTDLATVVEALVPIVEYSALDFAPVVIPARLLAAVARALDGNVVKISRTVESNRIAGLKVECGTSRFCVYGLAAASNFPVEGEGFVEVEAVIAGSAAARAAEFARPGSPDAFEAGVWISHSAGAAAISRGLWVFLGCGDLAAFCVEAESGAAKCIPKAAVRAAGVKLGEDGLGGASVRARPVDVSWPVRFDHTVVPEIAARAEFAREVLLRAAVGVAGAAGEAAIVCAREQGGAVETVDGESKVYFDEADATGACDFAVPGRQLARVLGAFTSDRVRVAHWEHVARIEGADGEVALVGLR